MRNEGAKVVSKCFGWDVDWSDESRMNLAYGESAGKVRANLIREYEWEWSELTHIKCYRIPEFDLVEQDSHKLISSLSEMQIKIMNHAIGNTKTGDPYRNYFLCNGDENWEYIITLELAKSEKAGENVCGTIYYSLTPLGIEVVRSLYPVSRHLMRSRSQPSH